MIWLFIVPILLFSVILHEVAHGYVAYLNGDPTAKTMKRLTLNPLPHIDPVGTVLLPMILILLQSPVLFGWAKPVPFNPRYFKNLDLGLFTVSLAGPMTNILLACLFSVALRLSEPESLSFIVLVYAVSINIILAVFNMIPIPPMDGSKVVCALLPRNLQLKYLSLERWGILIIFILLFMGLLHRVIIPIYLKIFQWLTGISFS